MKKQLTFFAAGWLVILPAFLTGCKHTGERGPAGRYAITVELDSELKNAPVIVDFVGVNQSSLPRWMAEDMTKYWRGEDTMRKDALRSMHAVSLNFASGQTMSQTLPATDPHWDKWMSEGVTDLLVLADLPGPQTSRPGTEDARRQLLTLDKWHWPKRPAELKILVQRSLIQVVTPPRSP